jgi:hypothetical protein
MLGAQASPLPGGIEVLEVERAGGDACPMESK